MMMVVDDNNLQPEACVLVAPLASDRSAQCIFAVAIVGTPDERAAAAAWAKAHGQPSGPTKGQGDVDEEMISFRPSMSMAYLGDLYAALRAGKFGRARMQMFISPKASSADGIDLENEAQVVDSSQIVLPQPDGHRPS